MLHERLGVVREQVGRIDVLQGPSLPNGDVLFDRAFLDIEQTKLEDARTVLAAALLAKANETAEGRLSAGLVLLSRLVAQASPESLFGEGTAELRERAMPNGWRHGTGSWMRFRYAWREGLADVVGASSDDPVVQALDELTRLSPHEPEPVAVSIQEQSQSPDATFFFSMGGILMGIYGIYSSYNHQNKVEKQMDAIHRKVGKPRR